VATSPTYTSTPRLMAGLVPATQDTSFTAPTHVTSLGSGVAAGTKINEIDVVPVGTTVAGLVNIFAYDGTTYHLLPGGSVVIGAVTVSATTPPYIVATLTFDNLILPSASWSLAVSNTEASNVSLIEVIALGADLT
jgi:hypothetical protein